jgi:putative toxin-antitoxin system antitoxin component (TIGR02293 family)
MRKRAKSAAAEVFNNNGRPAHKMTSFEKMEMVEEGISKKTLEELKNNAELDYDQLAEMLNVARATLINKKGNEKFNQDVSDKIMVLADIYSYGYEVFEDKDHFNEWIFRKNQALGNQTPFDLLHNTFGREEVKNLIGRIDHGIYS